MSHYQETIAAISTALAQGAIAIVRLSGDRAIEIADSIFSGSLKEKESHTISYGWIMDAGEKVDEVLVSLFRAPKTYTREDLVEINCHGGPYAARAILKLLLSKGAKLADPGEFTQRAFINGRIDLAQAEAVQAMTEASSKQTARMAAEGISGSVACLLNPLIDDLLDLIAVIEVNIDYPEYDDVEQMTATKLLPPGEKLLERLDEIILRSRRCKQIVDGISVAIIGKPNVGKSSLLNALLDEDKAIVADLPGTTRDLVEGQIHIGSTLLALTDTAGIRHSSDAIEQIGVQKSLEKIDDAQLVLLVLDGSKPLDDQDQELLERTKDKKRIIVINKCDLTPAFTAPEGAITISAANGQIEELVDAVESMVLQDDLSTPPLLSNERQIGLMMTARTDMLRATEAMKEGTEPDLIEIDLQDAYENLKEILGEVSRDDLLDTLFSQFCLGK